MKRWLDTKLTRRPIRYGTARIGLMRTAWLGILGLDIHITISPREWW